MPSHRYAVGSQVTLQSAGLQFHKDGYYIVEALLPPMGSSLQYRIKSEREGFRRVATEHQLSPKDAKVDAAQRISASFPDEPG